MTRVNRQIWNRVKKEERKLLLLSLFLLFFLSFLSFVCLHFLCWDFSILHLLVPHRAFLAELQGVNESVSGKHVDFCFHGDPEGLTMSQRLRPTDWRKALLSLFFRPSFIRCFFFSTLHSPFSFLLFFKWILSVGLTLQPPPLCLCLYRLFSLIRLFKASLFLFRCHFFLSLFFPLPDPLYSAYPLSSFVVIYVWRALINEDKHSSVCVCVGVCLRDGRQLSDSIVSLSTSPHSTAHPATGFLPPSSPSIQAPSQEGSFGGQVRPGWRLHCGAAEGVGAGGWGPGIQAKSQTQDPDLACQSTH